MQKLRKFIQLFEKLKFILTMEQRKKSVFIFFLILLSSLLELFSVSVVLPFVYALLDPRKLLENRGINFVLNIFSIQLSSSTDIVYLMGIAIVVVFALRCVALLWANYARIEFENKIMRDMSNQMMDCYLCRPYEDLTDISSSEAVRGVNTGATSIYYTLQSFFMLFSSFINAALISVFLLFVDLKMALELVVLGVVFVGGMLLATKKKVKKSGEEFNESMLLLNQYAKESIEGLKEITVSRKRKFFITKVESVTQKKKLAEQRYRFLQYYPNVLIQSIIVCIVVLIACLSLYQGGDSGKLLPSLAAFGYGAIKIIPSISTISASLTTLLYYYDSFNDAYNNISAGRDYLSYKGQILGEIIDENDKKPIDFSVINISHLNWEYKGGRDKILNDLSLKIHKGECVGIIGQSGAGKTTLADILLGLLEPIEKECVMADDVDIFKVPNKWAHTVGYVPQNIFLMDDSIKNNVLFGEEDNELNQQKVLRALDQAHILDFVLSLPEGINTVVGESGTRLSGGQCQRIALARALFNDPSLLILDEATSALDNETEKAVMESIKYLQGKKTMLIIAHRLSTIDNCDKVYEIKDGKAILRNGKE